MFLIIFVIIIHEPANCMPDVLKSFNKRQKKLLDSFRHCTIRMVFLEHSYPASLDVHLFLNHYKNQATFFLESIPADYYRYNTHSKLALTAIKDLKFRICYVIFYFQDEITDATREKVHLSVTSFICKYFKKYTISLRSENPSFINFITYRKFLNFLWYKCLKNIDTTSVFYRFSTDGVDRIFIKFGNPMLVASNYHEWDER